MFEPPQDECTSPIGTRTVFCNSRAKKKQAADQAGTVSGAALCHITGLAKSVCGAELLACSTVSMRILSFVESRISLSVSPARRTGNSMFDCPEQRNTSPTSTSCTDCATPDLPCAVNTKGPPALNAGNVTLHRPEASARALALTAASETVMSSPPAACPHTSMGLSRCKTA